jgi:preprotein translocase subunit SecD
VRELDGFRIEVALYSTDAAEAKHVEQLLQRAGTLEFRILANKRDNRDLIERALAEPSKTRLLDDKSRLLAWWVPVKASEKVYMAGDSNLALCERKTGDGQTTEVLVNNDHYNITGAYLRWADVDTDSLGQPCIRLRFNKPGGELLGLMTTYYSPDQSTDFTYRLGIILDGELYSAPKLRGAIREYAQIAGSFTMQEVHNLVNVLNSGSLPARIRPVKK